ncbi:MAG: pentapeptide repeat-containing protein [Thermosynechococcaceae cyanobacterium MS004]|nr:pentapeptide repeat-containing protein [Thermosynechococcaceae cyanobacterium MS004]
MAKRWLAKREKSIPVLRRSFIVWTLVIAALVLFFCKPSWFWPGGFGIDKGETVTTERVEKDAKGIPVKTTTKRDDGKTLWDWMSLLGVPLSLAILGYWLQQNQQKRAEVVAKEQREIAADETKEEVLQVYFDRLSALLVDKNLLAIASKVNATETQEAESHPINAATLEERELLDSAVDVIRARTLSILRRFENDPDRKTSVIRFLIDADVVSKLELSLSDADLTGVGLIGADLRDANLNGADFSDASLIRASLIGARLIGADLIRVRLIGADLSNAILVGADLRDSTLIGATLIGAKFTDADLRSAKFGNNPGLSDTDKADMKARGAIFEDSP